MALLAAVVSSAGAQEPPGTPQPSTGAPAAQPGENSPFGGPGGIATASPSLAEEQLASYLPRLERIEITGNRRISEDRIRREMALRPGDRLDPEKVLTARLRLFELSAFSRVDAEIAPGSSPGLVVLRVEVQEKLTFQIPDLVVYSTPAASLVVGGGVASADFLRLGIAAAISAVGGPGDRYGGRFVLYDPAVTMLGGAPLAGLQLGFSHGRENACGTPDCGGHLDRAPWLHYERIGGSAVAGLRSGVIDRFLVGYRFEAIESSLDPGSVAPPFVHLGTSRLSSLILAFDRDSRPERFLPARGTRVGATLEVSSAIFGSDYDFSRVLLQGEQWIPLGRLALRIDLAAGLVQGDPPFFDRFYAADWSYFTVGLAAPRVFEINFSSDSRYDRVLLVAGAELAIPLWNVPGNLLSRGYLAVGARDVFSEAGPGAGRTKQSSTPLSADVSLRMESPVGTISLSLGIVVDITLKAAGVGTGI